MIVLDTVAEAFAALRGRPGRAALTMAGTLLGVAAVVATLGLAETAGRQVSGRFDALRSTEVRVELETGSKENALPDDYAERLMGLNGVAAVGSIVEVRSNAAVATTSVDGVGMSGLAGVVGLGPGTEDALRFEFAEGRSFDALHHASAADVAILGPGIAARLNIPPLWTRPVVFVDGHPRVVVGLLNMAPTEPRASGWVMVPASAAPGAGAPTLVIRTDPGAAQVIARQAPAALRPEAPHLFVSSAPPDPGLLRLAVESDTRTAFLVAAGVVLLVGALGIATATLVAVVERTPEFGIRRAIGASPAHIAGLVMTESTLIGTLGGAFGSSLGVIAVVGLSARAQWTPVMDPLVPFIAVGLGAVTGLLAGLIPAIRAGQIEPVEALRR